MADAKKQTVPLPGHCFTNFLLVTNMKKITPEFIESKIIAEHYWFVPGTTCTVCALLTNDVITEIGESHAILGEEYSEEAGRMFSRRDAFGKLVGAYTRILKHKISEESRNVDKPDPVQVVSV